LPLINVEIQPFSKIQQNTSSSSFFPSKNRSYSFSCNSLFCVDWLAEKMAEKLNEENKRKGIETSKINKNEIEFFINEKSVPSVIVENFNNKYVNRNIFLIDLIDKKGCNNKVFSSLDCSDFTDVFILLTFFFIFFLKDFITSFPCDNEQSTNSNEFKIEKVGSILSKEETRYHSGNITYSLKVMYKFKELSFPILENLNHFTPTLHLHPALILYSSKYYETLLSSLSYYPPYTFHSIKHSKTSIIPINILSSRILSLIPPSKSYHFFISKSHLRNYSSWCNFFSSGTSTNISNTPSSLFPPSSNSRDENLYLLLYKLEILESLLNDFNSNNNNPLDVTLSNINSLLKNFNFPSSFNIRDHNWAFYFISSQGIIALIDLLFSLDSIFNSITSSHSSYSELKSNLFNIIVRIIYKFLFSNIPPPLYFSPLHSPSLYSSSFYISQDFHFFDVFLQSCFLFFLYF
jgi:hypothetical protein